MNLNSKSIADKKVWENIHVELPKFNVDAMIQETKEHPTWIHFGAGNIFRGFIAQLQQRLLNEGKTQSGIIAVDTFDYDIIDKIYDPFDNLTLLVLMNPDGELDKEVIASISMALRGDSENTQDYNSLKDFFSRPSLQMVSFTITEKGYALKDIQGNYFPVVEQDIEKGPGKTKHAMSLVIALLYERFKNGAQPIALVSMDNCSHNGAKLQSSVTTIANEWAKRGFVEDAFLSYLNNEEKVTFPWTMIDKITPRPSDDVMAKLEQLGIEGMQPIITSKNTHIAPFVNAEIPQYLVVEDKFPNGRPPLEDAGVYMTDRETVNNTERMKVTTCLNPLHTALAIYGCLLDYKSIAEEMRDSELKKLVEKIGYDEGMPVVVDPKILNPEDFIHEVIDLRLPNPYIPDSPQRIVTDTSQKMAIRFGETIKSYMERPDLDAKSLKYIPLVIAGWFRYLLGVNDSGESMELSPDPMADQLRGKLEGIALGKPETYTGNLREILSNSVLFGVDLYEAGLGDKIESMFVELITASDAVRNTLKKYL